VLLELAENTKLASKWGEEVDTKFGVDIFYTRLRSPHELYTLIETSQNKYLKKNKREFKKVELIEQKGEGFFKILHKKLKYPEYIYLKSFDNEWVLFSENGYLLKAFKDKILRYIPSISTGWISYRQMNDLINEYANYGGIRATARAPHYQMPKRSPLTVEERKKIPSWYFEDLRFTVLFWAPKRIFHEKEDMLLNQFKISREYLNRIDQVELGAEFTNPGKSRLVIDRNSSIRHIKDVPEATQKVFDTVFNFSSKWIESFNDCLPLYEYKKDSEGNILNLKQVKPPKVINFDVFHDKKTKMGFSDLIKLQQMLTVGDETDLLGYINKHDDTFFDLDCTHKNFSDDANVKGVLQGKKIRLSVFPGKVPGPFVINQIYKVANQFAWHVSDPEIKDG